jgi:hypothetical protein
LGKSNITKEQKDVLYNIYDVVQNTKKYLRENEINNKIFLKTAVEKASLVTKVAFG